MTANIRRGLVAVGALAVVASGSASAAVDPSVTTAISGAATDAGVVGAAVLVVFVGIAAIKWVRKAL